MIVTYTSSMPAKAGGLVWFPLEIRECIDPAVISGARRVIRRTPCILGIGALALINPFHVEVILEDGGTP